MTDRTPASDLAKNKKAPKKKRQRARITGFTVMLDACVLVSSNVRDVLLWCAELALFRPTWSADILDEVRRTLTEKMNVHPDRAEYALQQMREAFPEAEVDGYNAILASMTNDEGDRHVLAACVIAGAQVIVTDNLKHFPVDALKPYYIEALSADDFLCDLFDLDPDRMVEVLTTISERRKMPPKTVEQLLDALEKCGCSKFVGELRTHWRAIYG